MLSPRQFTDGGGAGTSIAKGAATGAALGPVGMMGGAAAGGAIAAAPKVAKAAAATVKTAAPIAAKAAGAGAGMVRAAAPSIARNAAIAGPVGMAGAAAYGASQTPGGKSIIKGAVKGAGGPNMGVPGPIGAAAGAIKGAATSQGAKNVASGAAKGGLIGALGGPVGMAAGSLIGGVAGLFSHRGMGNKPKAATGSPVPNRATPYTVQKGDTLTSIAKAKGTSVEALRKANPKFMEQGSKYKNGNMIWSGTKVNLK